MQNVTVTTSSEEKDEEIDLMQIIGKLWKAKKLIIAFMLLFMILGTIIAIFSDKEYTATTVMVPQKENKNSGSLGGLAAMAGITLGSGSNEAIPLSSYSKIIESVPFKKKLVQPLLPSLLFLKQ